MSTLDVLVIRLLQPPSYEHEDLERQNDDDQDSVKIDGHVHILPRRFIRDFKNH
jgi:hypothetical protein